METPHNRFLDPDLIVARMGIREGMHVADLGCGTGHLVLSMARAIAPEGHAYAVDLDPEMVSSARSYVFHEGLRDATFIVADLVLDPLSEIPAGSLDVVVLSSTLHEMGKDGAKVIRKARDLLRSDGQLLVIEWQKKMTVIGPPLSTRLDETEVVAMVQKAGFISKDTFEAGTCHFGVVCEPAPDTQQGGDLDKKVKS